MAFRGYSPWFKINSTFSLKSLTAQVRAYARPSRSRAVVNPSRPAPPAREVWVDPFKAPPPPKANFRVLVRPALFTAVVLILADPIADAFVERRTKNPATKAERQAETSNTILPIIGINVAIFGLWRVAPSFCHRIGALLIPYAPSPTQLIVSTFSHQDILHLLFNQIVLYSFGSIICDTLGREHFLSFYLQAACVSSLASVAASQAFVRMGFFDVSRLRVGTLGASGSLMAIVGTSTVIYPEMPVGFMFIPFVSFPLKYIMVGLVAFDVTGIAARWQTFDHAAHVSLLFHGLR